MWYDVVRVLWMKFISHMHNTGLSSTFDYWLFWSFSDAPKRISYSCWKSSAMFCEMFCRCIALAHWVKMSTMTNIHHFQLQCSVIGPARSHLTNCNSQIGRSSKPDKMYSLDWANLAIRSISKADYHVRSTRQLVPWASDLLERHYSPHVAQCMVKLF